VRMVASCFTCKPFFVENKSAILQPPVSDGVSVLVINSWDITGEATRPPPDTHAGRIQHHPHSRWDHQFMETSRNNPEWGTLKRKRSFFTAM
jgi:hypothetical protein